MFSGKGSILLRIELGRLGVVVFIEGTRHGRFHIWLNGLICSDAPIKKQLAFDV